MHLKNLHEGNWPLGAEANREGFSQESNFKKSSKQTENIIKFPAFVHFARLCYLIGSITAQHRVNSFFQEDKPAKSFCKAEMLAKNLVKISDML